MIPGVLSSRNNISGAPVGHCNAEVGGPWITYFCMKKTNGFYCKEHEVQLK